MSSHAGLTAARRYRRDQAPLKQADMPVFLIGGAEKAAELDAKRAIDQGTRLAAVLEDAKTGQVFNAPETLKAKVRGRAG